MATASCDARPSLANVHIQSESMRSSDVIAERERQMCSRSLYVPGAVASSTEGRASPSRFVEDMEMRALEGKLQLLNVQRELSAVKCRNFVEALESYAASTSPKPANTPDLSPDSSSRSSRRRESSHRRSSSRLDRSFSSPSSASRDRLLSADVSPAYFPARCMSASKQSLNAVSSPKVPSFAAHFARSSASGSRHRHSEELSRPARTHAHSGRRTSHRNSEEIARPSSGLVVSLSEFDVDVSPRQPSRRSSALPARPAAKGAAGECSSCGSIQLQSI